MGGQGRKAASAKGWVEESLKVWQRHLGTCGPREPWVAVGRVEAAGQSWPGACLTLEKERHRLSSFSQYLTPRLIPAMTHTPSQASQGLREHGGWPRGISGLEHLSVGVQWLQVLGQPFLAREKRKETDRQADSHQGRVLRLALGLLSQTVEPTLRVAK